MESNNKLKEIAIKNRTCYFFDDIIEIEDLDFEIEILMKLKIYILCKK